VAGGHTAFRAEGRLAILAGGGQLPVHVAEAARRHGEDPFIIGLRAEVDRDWSRFDHVLIGTGDFAALERAVKANGIKRMVMSGGVRRRPEWRELRPTLRTLLKMPKIVSTLLRSGDDQVLRMVIALLESCGVRVIGAQEIAPDLLAHVGSLTKAKPKPADLADIEAARAAALALGKLDIGQGAVAVGGRVVALEGPEGTDEMLSRVADLRRQGRISKTRRGVLVKFGKPQQDERADLPSIGLGTVRGLVSAGLSGVAVEAGRSLVLEREATIAAADEAGLFIFGIAAEDSL
jgi:DUF1009 family protein